MNQMRANLEKVEERERTNSGQWRHHFKAFSLILIAFVVQLVRGAKGHASIIGLETCSPEDTVILCTFLSICALMVIYEVRRVRYEQELKLSFNYG